MPDIAMQMPGIASEVAEIFRMCVGHSRYVPRYVPLQLIYPPSLNEMITEKGRKNEAIYIPAEGP